MATIKDVARLAGVGLGTASRVVSGKGSVSAATAARVRAAIETLEFRPSHAARSLLLGNTQMVGVFIPILKGTFYTPILQVIDMELRASGQHMVVAFGSGAGDARRQTIDGIEFLIERGCDGLIVISSALDDADIASLGPKQANLVVLNHRFPSIAEQCFTVNHTLGGKLAAQTLIEHGHRHFAIIAGPSSAPDNIERINAFRATLLAAGVDITRVPTLESDFSPEGGWAAAEKLLTDKHAFTALFCANDEMAIGALSRFQQAGIAVPTDISVLGYDDTPAAEFSAPRLSTVHLPWREVTTNALHWLLNRCYQSNHVITRDFPVSVTWRASVAAAKSPAKPARGKRPSAA